MAGDTIIMHPDQEFTAFEINYLRPDGKPAGFQQHGHWLTLDQVWEAVRIAIIVLRKDCDRIVRITIRGS